MSTLKSASYRADHHSVLLFCWRPGLRGVIANDYMFSFAVAKNSVLWRFIQISLCCKQIYWPWIVSLEKESHKLLSDGFGNFQFCKKLKFCLLVLNKMIEKNGSNQNLLRIKLIIMVYYFIFAEPLFKGGNCNCKNIFKDFQDF